MLKILR